MNLEKIKTELNTAFELNSETRLLSILKNNSFLFYELFTRKWGIRPIFHEITFGNKYRCDFAWLNDNSDGPEWVLVEVEKPKLKLFTKNTDPSMELNHSIQQVKNWKKYFDEYPHEKKRIFGSVARFRFILVGGLKSEWQEEQNAKWRLANNKDSYIEIRSSNVFYNAIEIYEKNPSEMWSFIENQVTLKPNLLENFVNQDSYLEKWKCIIN